MAAKPGRNKKSVNTRRKVDAVDKDRQVDEPENRIATRLVADVFKGCREGIAVLDNKMCYITVNDQYLIDYRISEKSLVGKCHYDIFPEIPEKWKDIHRRVLSGKTESSQEDLFIRSDGTVDYLWWECRPWYESPGKVGGMILYSNVVTERKRMEEELRQSRDELETRVKERTAALSRSEERLRLMIDVSPVPMIAYEESKNYYINKKFVETFGYTIVDIPSVNEWWPLAYPDREYREDVKKRWYSAVDRASETRTSIDPLDVHVTCKDGSQKHVLNYFSSIGDMNLSVFYDVTERKRAEEALLKSEAELKRAQQIAHIGSWTWDLLSDDITWSDESYRNYGLVPGEVKPSYELFLSFIVPEDRERVDKAVRRAVDSGEKYNVTYNITRKDGTPRVLLSENEVIKDGAGLVIKMYGTNQDITERKRADEALRESEKRLSRLYNSGLLGVIYWNMDGIITDANDKFLEMMGYTREDLLTGRIDWVHMTPPEFGHLDEQSVIELKATGVNKMPFEKEYIHKDGTRIPIILAGAMLDEARFNGVAFVLDITERKRAEEERKRLLESIDGQRRQLQAVMDAIPAGVVFADATGKLVQVNEFEKKIWGGTVPLADNWMDYRVFKGWWHDTGKPVTAEEWAMTRALTKGETILGEIVDIERFDGTMGTKLQSSAPVKDARGNIAGAVTIDIDITDRIKLEKDLNEARMQAELYLDLMGHDISNMHQIIIGQLELAQEIIDLEGKLDREDKEMIDTSVRTLQRSARLIENVRNLQKVRADNIQLERIDLGEVLDETVKGYTGIPGREISINYTPVHGCNIIANPLIKDIFNNLMDNAVKHCDDPVRINVVVNTVQDNGCRFYEVAVEDNGRGIPDNKKTEIFDRLKRGDTKARGTGLGLYIVKTLVEGFDGSVRVEDRIPGDHTRGAKFILSIPAEGGRKLNA